MGTAKWAQQRRPRPDACCTIPFFLEVNLLFLSFRERAYVQAWMRKCKSRHVNQWSPTQQEAQQLDLPQNPLCVCSSFVGCPLEHAPDVLDGNRLAVLVVQGLVHRAVGALQEVSRGCCAWSQVRKGRARFGQEHCAGPHLADDLQYLIARSKGIMGNHVALQQKKLCERSCQRGNF
eukprot:1155662-Pelagomonas_calceolata.AAC.1